MKDIKAGDLVAALSNARNCYKGPVFKVIHSDPASIHLPYCVGHFWFASDEVELVDPKTISKLEKLIYRID